MSKRHWTRAAALAGLLCTIATAAGALPLTYTVVAAESNIFVRDRITSTIDVSPDYTDTVTPPNGNFPYTEIIQGASNTQPSPISHVIADVGLPGAFNNGANGIAFSELVIHTFNAPGAIVGSANIPVPLAPLGSNTIFVTVTASVTSLQITLNAPFSSTLTPSANPNEWLWSGVADVTISGSLQPQLLLPGGVAAPTPAPTPFSQNVLLPLLGTFNAVNGGGTRVNVGIASDALQDQDLSQPPFSQQIDLLDLGLVTLTMSLNTLILEDISSSIVYQNATPIPEPGTALLLGLGLVGLAVRRSR